jgi:hypothetical protein
MNLAKLPGYAGVCTRAESQRIGLSVAEVTRRLRRIAYVKTRLAFLAVAHFNSTPEWEVKSALALHAWLDIEHATASRNRLLDLRENESRLDEVPAPALDALMDEALRAQNTAELVTAIYGVIRPALLETIDRYIEESNPLADQPSCRALKLIRIEESETMAWGAAALAAINDSCLSEAERFAQHLNAYLAHAGGIDGSTPMLEGELPRPRAARPFVPDLEPRRDERFHGLYDTSVPADMVYADESRPIEERNLALLFKRVREMDVPEAIASILAESSDQSWQYYHDMFRQMWDEARHALLGQVALEAHGVDWTQLPVNVTFSYKLAKFLNARERHILLYGIEQSLMPGNTGKKYEWEIARASGDALSMNFHDFDWADEVLHAAIGRRHLRTEFPEQTDMIRSADKLVARIAEGLKNTALPQDAPSPDWWEKFAASVLGHAVPKVNKTHLTEWKPVSS